MSDLKRLYLLKILHIVNYQLSIDSLVQLGLGYSQIAKMISDAIQGGYISENDEEGLEITQKGLKQLELLNKRLYPLNTKNWILPEEESRIDKISIFDVYLPKKRRPS